MRADLKKHYEIGRVIAAVVALLAALALLKLTEMPWPVATTLSGFIGYGVGTAAGWLKEYWWDAKGRGTVDADDYKWTRRGAAHGAALAMAALFIIGALL